MTDSAPPENEIDQLRRRVRHLETELRDRSSQQLLLVREAATLRQRLLLAERSVVLLEQRLSSVAAVLRAPRTVKPEEIPVLAQQAMVRARERTGLLALLKSAHRLLRAHNLPGVADDLVRIGLGAGIAFLDMADGD